MKLNRARRVGARRDAYAGVARVHPSACYDLLVSLRALYNPRTYTATRGWAARTRKALGPAFHERGRFYFQGFDTALGYGAARYVVDLPAGAGPSDLLAVLRRADPRQLALFMADTGETSAETLEAYAALLHGRGGPRELDRALRTEPPEWARRVRRVLSEPAAAQAEYLLLLEEYLAAAFTAEVPAVQDALAATARRAAELLTVLPTVEAIEQLTGGYTLADDLPLRRITLAPSVFVHPFMSTRVDERTGEALVLFGAGADLLARYEPVPVDPGLVRALKALADPERLRILRLIGEGVAYGAELVPALGLAQPTVHHHLVQLRTAGFIRQERARGGMRYAVRADQAADVMAALRALLDPPGRTPAGRSSDQATPRR